MFSRVVDEMDIQRIGRELLAELKVDEGISGSSEKWIDQLFEGLMANDAFRVQALRFVDVMPTLSSDKELIEHYQSYFSDIDTEGLPTFIRWGIERTSRSNLTHLLAPVIRQGVNLVAHKFIAGTDLKATLHKAADLKKAGMDVSLDILGEATLSEIEADDYQRRYLEVIEQGSQIYSDRVRATTNEQGVLNLSIKLSSLYSQMSAVDTEGSAAAVAERLRPLFRAAMAQGVSMTLDMEQYNYKEIILKVFMDLLMEEEFRTWAGAGIAIQAYLREAESDVERIIEWVESRGTPIMVRLVRGAYWDMETVLARQNEWEVPVWMRKQDTDACYERCLHKLFEASSLIRTAVATHNLRSIACALALVDAHKLLPDAYEFQMLYGMTNGMDQLITSRGLALRLYMPYGELMPAIAYLVRRLLENSSEQSIMRSLGEQTPEEVLNPPYLEEAGAEPTGLKQGFKNHPLHRFVQIDERRDFDHELARVNESLGDSYPLRNQEQEEQFAHWIVSRNPSHPTQVIGEVEAAQLSDIDSALGAAISAQREWRRLSMSERAGFLESAAVWLSERRDWFAAWQVKEAAKNRLEADGDVVEAIDFLNYYAAQARKMGEPLRNDRPGESNQLVYEPLGIGVVLPPWNFPLAIPVGMLSAAIVTGNTVIFKPASNTPVIAWHFVQMLREIGLPEGVVTWFPGEGREVGEALIKDPRIHFAAFTGSREVGLRINRLAAKESPGHVKRIIAEMGGKNAVIVDADADLDDAIAGIINSAFGFQGQKCSACSRVICVGDVHDLFVKRLIDAVKSLRIGDPASPGNRVGPVIDEVAHKRIFAAIEKGKEVATLAYQAAIPEHFKGYFIGPTVFTDVPVDSALAQDEIFGPVLSVLRAVDFDQALEIANGTCYALTGGVYSRNPYHLSEAEKRFNVGNLYLNRKITQAIVACQPFGGFKLSGMGNKAGGPDYLMQFVHARSITENTLRRGFAPEFGAEEP